MKTNIFKFLLISAAFLVNAIYINTLNAKKREGLTSELARASSYGPPPGPYGQHCTPGQCQYDNG